MAKKTVTITIAGTSPLLLNRYRGNNDKDGANDTPEQICTKKLYFSETDDSTLIIPGTNLFRCIIEAGKFHKMGKCKVTTQRGSLIPAFIEMDSFEVPLMSNEGWYPYENAIRNPTTGGRQMINRPRFNDWTLTFTLKVDEKNFPLSMVREIVDDAGCRVGLGDYRPDCKGPFGKFVITNWEVEGSAQPKTARGRKNEAVAKAA